MLKIAIFNFKGGTGKSTTALNLGACLATSKRKVLLIDLDGQRTLSFGLAADGKKPTALDWLTQGKAEPLATDINNLYLIPGDLGMFQLQADRNLFTPALAKLSEFEMGLMDCSPGLTIASVQAILSSDRILIPTTCEPAALKGLSEAVELIRAERADAPIDILRCRYKPRLLITKEADDLLKEGAEELNYHLLKTVIPENIAVAEAIAHQQPITAYNNKSAGAAAYRALAKEYLGVCK
ncbi:ParA family protein [Oscillatoria laete-virens NRMC-F 0139]|nr:ParA family protein [Oscillatoria laete-virens]MDL5055390.1 ParA family protein [Oscillatoria laete-virens NRMC-F 0139]